MEYPMNSPEPTPITTVAGSLDGAGAADHDLPFRFHRPRVSAPYPFSTRQYARLLALRSRVDAGLFGDDHADIHIRRTPAQRAA
jgi:hypothetical protein